MGSEGTLGTVLEAEVRLVVDDPRRLLLVLGYDTVSEAADAVPHILDAVHGEYGPHSLIACEGMDSRLVALVRSAGKPVPQLPGGQSWLFVEAAGEAASAVLERVRTASAAVDTRFIESPAEAAALWKIREDGAGLAGISLDTPAHSGWEDSAVPPKHLGAWMRDFESLLKEFGLQGYPYGHFGDGCIHCRIDFPFQHGDPSSTETPPAPGCSGSSCWPAPKGSRSTGDRSPASTATAGSAPNCCPSCTTRPPWISSPRQNGSVTRRTC